MLKIMRYEIIQHHIKISQNSELDETPGKKYVEANFKDVHE